MSARLVSAVPAWYEVRGTTGSPSFTSSSRTVPAMGARMIDSTARRSPLRLPFTRPFSMRASLSDASSRRIRASWMSLSAWSQSCVARMPWSRRVRERSYFFWAWSKTFFAISTSRRASVSSIGVGSGRISNRGSPGRTLSPISRKEVFTMPEILLLTAISRLGRMAPIASAFSTTDPRVTGTVLNPLDLLELDLLYKTAVTPPAITITPATINPLRMVGDTFGPHRLERRRPHRGFQETSLSRSTDGRRGPGR